MVPLSFQASDRNFSCCNDHAFEPACDVCTRGDDHRRADRRSRSETINRSTACGRKDDFLEDSGRLESLVGWAKARSSRAVPTGLGRGGHASLRFAHPTTTTFPYESALSRTRINWVKVTLPTSADLHARMQRGPSASYRSRSR